MRRNGSALANANATTVFSQTGASKTAFTRSIIDNPGAGTHTYSMATVGGWSFNAGGTYTVKDIQIQVMLVSR